MIEPITDTQVTIEEANISAAGDVTVIVGGTNNDIGSATGYWDIDFTAENFKLEDADRIALSAAERADVAYLAGGIASARVDFINNSASGDTIVRKDNGNWLTDGFQSGMTIQIFGNAENASENGQFFTIASVDASTITLSGSDELTTEYRANISLAEIIADPTANSSGITGIRIDLRDDVDVDALGSISATATGDVFLGSELDIKLGEIRAGDTARIKTGKAIENISGSRVTNVISTDLILEAADGSIGSASSPLTIDIGNDSILTARVSGDMHITERTGNINVGTLYAQSGGIYLTADSGAIVDGLNHDFANISAATELVLKASGSVGENGDYLETDLVGSAVLDVSAVGDIYIDEVLGNMNVRQVVADGGDIDLRAHLAILDTQDASGNDISGLPEADVIGNSITLTSELDAIGISGNDLDINSAWKGAGTVTTSSGKDTYLIETDGDLSIHTIGTGDGFTAFILGRDDILNGNSDANASNVTSGKTRLFAEGNIGAAHKRLQTTVGYMEGRSTNGDVWITNTGSLTIGGLNEANGLVASGEVNIEAHSPITIEKSIISNSVNNAGNIIITSGDDAGDNADYLTIASGVLIQSTAGTVTLRSGDNLTVESGATVSAAGQLLLQGDYGNAEEAGVTMSLLGSFAGSAIAIEGGSDDDIIFINADLLAGDTTVTGGEGNDVLEVKELHSRSESLSLDGQEGGDQYIITTTDVDADGTTLTDYAIDINDSGDIADGADSLTIHGRGYAGDSGAETDDIFLVRSNFVARLHGELSTNTFADAVERINYNSTLNDAGGGVFINGGAGNDSFFMDDTSSIMTIDGGSDRDNFQVGQIFGEEPVTAGGDDVAGTLVTRGFLSYGNSEALILKGGTGGDIFTVYSNKANLLMQGESGNDEFVVRAFVADSGIDLQGGDDDDTIDYNINAPVNIDGGSGFDTLTAIGTEKNDTFRVTRDSIIGAGLTITYDGLESVDVDAMEGNDTFIVESTRSGVITNLIGGLGSDHFIVGSEGETSAIQGSLVIEGGLTTADRSLTTPVVLPSEQATSALDIPSITDETIQTDTLTVFNDASTTDDSGRLTTSLLSGFNMDDKDIVVPGENGEPDRTYKGGITYLAIEALEIVLGQGNDTMEIDTTAVSVNAAVAFAYNANLNTSTMTRQDGGSWYEEGYRAGDTIEVTGTSGNDGRFKIASVSADGSQLILSDEAQLVDESANASVKKQAPITVVHGGGNQSSDGGDTFTVTGGDDSSAPLILFGDTSQNGSRYNSLRGDGLDTVVSFSTAGNDRIDASGSRSGITLYGGAGDDTLIGSNGHDRIFGGSGNDQISGLGGNDFLYGDSGINVDISSRLTLASQVITVVTAPDLVNNSVNSDYLQVGNDIIDGGFGDDVIFGDHGAITQTRDGSLDQLLLMTTGNLAYIETTEEEHGGDDVLYGGDDNDMILAGNGADQVSGGAGNDILLGDSGEVNLNADGDLHTIDLAQNRNVAQGGNDTLQGNSGNDWLLGGIGADILYGANEDGSAIGLLETDDDLILGDFGVVTLAAGQAISLASARLQNGGNDTIHSGFGNNVVIAGQGDDEVTATDGDDAIIGDNGIAELTNDGLIILASTDLDDSTGGNDVISSGDGFNRVIGGTGIDTVTGGTGVDHVIGDHGTLTYDMSNILQKAESRLINQGGNDVISSAGGSNIVVAGHGADNVATTGGDDVVIGDNGRAEFTNGNLITLTSTDLDDSTGGHDVLSVGEGFNRVIGGTGNDIIAGETGVDQVIGDHGRMTWSQSGILREAVSLLPSQGGNDIIQLSSGRNTVIAGMGNDRVVTGIGGDHILGDNGIVQYDATGVITLIETRDFGFGDNDTLQTGDGNNLVLAGYGDDTVATGAGEDSVIGDNGRITFVDGIRSRVETLDTTEATGGNDTVSLGDGEDQALGGIGNDTVENSSGITVIIGDDGVINSDDEGRYLQAATGIFSIGGGDTLTGGSDRDILFGGAANDDLSGNDGDDLIVGDGAQVTRTSLNLILETIDFFQGGDDTLRGGDGLDRMIGSFGSDLFYGNLSEDIMVGEYARMTFAEEGTTEQATVIVTLAQGALDHLRAIEKDLYTKVNEVFSTDYIDLSPIRSFGSQNAMTSNPELTSLLASMGAAGDVSRSSAQAAGIDYPLPTEPTAAGEDDGSSDSTHECATGEQVAVDEYGRLICEPEAYDSEAPDSEEPVEAVEPEVEEDNADDVLEQEPQELEDAAAASMVLASAALMRNRKKTERFDSRSISEFSKHYQQKQKQKRFIPWDKIAL